MLAMLIAGILLSYYEVLPLFRALVAGGVMFALLLLAGTIFVRWREVLWWGAVWVFLFCFGMWNSARAVQRSEWDEPPGEPQIYCVQVTTEPVEKANSWQVHVRLADRKEAILYVMKDSLLQLPAVGDMYLVRTSISRPMAADEYSFDYGKYLQQQGIAGTGVVSRAGMLFLRHERVRGFVPFMRSVRSQVEHLFDGFALRERSVLEALLLGDRRHLSADTREAFAASGAMHVLAVSGLHVGIIASILMWIVTLGKWRKPKYTTDNHHYWRAAVLCSFLVFYGFLTGLSPSVTRSVLMFILLAVGSLIRPKRSRYNDVASSAFLILMFSPLTLFHSGFLLSYSAVLAIIRFYPSLRLYTKSKFLNGVWSIVAVSLCAQLGTLPWTIYYFHRVSNYFVLTNLGVLPLVEYVLIPTFFVFLALSALPVAGAFVGGVLERETWVLNEYVSWVQQLPGSSAEVYLNGWLTALLVAIIVCFMLRGKGRRWAAGVLSMVFVCSLVYDYACAGREQDLQVYRRSNSLAVMAREGTACVVLSNDSAYALSATHDYRLARHVQTCSVLPLDSTQRYTVFRWQGEPYVIYRNKYGKVYRPTLLEQGGLGNY